MMIFVYRWMMLHKHVNNRNETPFFRNENLNPISISCIGSHYAVSVTPWSHIEKMSSPHRVGSL
jgi:hypothetical protein